MTTTTPAAYPYEPTTYPQAPQAPQEQPVGHLQAPAPTTALEALTEAPQAPEPEPEKLKLAEITETLNGFDQIAIRSRFHQRFDELAEDPLMLARALYFVHLRREGSKDAVAFEASMAMPMSQLNGLFDSESEEDELEGDESAIAERDTAYADFVIGTGLSLTVDQYMELTLQQRSKMIEAANRR